MSAAYWAEVVGSAFGSAVLTRAALRGAGRWRARRRRPPAPAVRVLVELGGQRLVDLDVAAAAALVQIAGGRVELARVARPGGAGVTLAAAGGDPFPLVVTLEA